MSDIEQGLDAQGPIEWDDYSSRSFNEKVGIVDECYETHFTRGQSIANLEKQVKKLSNRLSYELSLIRNDLAEWFGKMKKTREQPGKDVGELTNNILCGDFIQPSRETNGLFKSLDGEYGDVVNLKLGIDSVFARLERAHEKTVADYEQKLKNKDQVVESMKKKLQALEATAAKNTDNSIQTRERITKKESEKSKLTLCVKAKEREVINLRYLLEQADEKLENRLRQMKLTEAHLTRLITEVKTNEVKQTKDVHIVAKKMKTVVSSLTDIRDRINQAHGIMKIHFADVPAHLTRLQQLFQPMIEKLSAKPVAARLFQDDVLSLTELERVQCANTFTEAAEYLLSRILSKPSDVSYNSFLTALEATNQGDILLWLTYDDFNIDSQHTNLIRRKYTFLLEELNPQDSGLIAVLFEKKVIDQHEKGILSCESAVRQAERLLSMLSRKSMEQFDEFLVALDLTGQGHIANELRRCQRIATSGANVIDAVEGRKAADEDTTPPLPPRGRHTKSAVSSSKISLSTSSDGEQVMNSAPMKNGVSSITAAAAAAGHRTQYNYKGSMGSRSITPAITHVISASDDCKGDVIGLTVHDDELFIVRYWSPKGLVEVYNETNFTFKRYIRVKELEGSCWVRGLTSCDTNNCLYVSCGYIGGGVVGRYIVRVELTGSNKVVKWGVKDDYVPLGLSVNILQNLIVACWGQSHKLIEYTTRGESVREILLQDKVEYPWHAIQLINGQFLVSHGDYNSLRRVCVVDANGRVLVSYGNKPGSDAEQLKDPRHLAVDSNGFIYVADRDNDRIVMLDSTLKWSRDLRFGTGSGMKRPCSLHLDEQSTLLLVGEKNGDNSQVVVVTV